MAASLTSHPRDCVICVSWGTQENNVIHVLKQNNSLVTTFGPTLQVTWHFLEKTVHSSEVRVQQYRNSGDLDMCRMFRHFWHNVSTWIDIFKAPFHSTYPWQSINITSISELFLKSILWSNFYKNLSNSDSLLIRSRRQNSDSCITPSRNFKEYRHCGEIRKFLYHCSQWVDAFMASFWTISSKKIHKYHILLSTYSENHYIIFGHLTKYSLKLILKRKKENSNFSWKSHLWLKIYQSILTTVNKLVKINLN